MPPQVTKQTFVTVSDCIEHALDYLGGTADNQANRDCLRAILASYREVTNARLWNYLLTHGRIVTDPPYTTGTVCFVPTGYTYQGVSYPRALILSGGTWPTEVGGQTIGPGWTFLISAPTPTSQNATSVSYATSDVESYVSPTIVTLTQDVNPMRPLDHQPAAITGLTKGNPTSLYVPNHGLATGNQVVVEQVKVASGSTTSNGTWTITVTDSSNFTLNSSNSSSDGTFVSGTWRLYPTTSFTLYHDTYELPLDFVKMDTAIYEGNFGGLEYSDPTDALWWQRFMFNAGFPRFYSITGYRSWPGQMGIKYFPYPIESKTIDMTYLRRPRDLLLSSLSSGTVGVTNGGFTVTANGFVFPSTCVGSVLRLATANQGPTSWIGSNPPTYETLVYSWVNSSTITVTDAVPLASGNYPYVLSDPIDVEKEAMVTAIYRGIEKHLQIARNIQGKPDAALMMMAAMKEAESSDSRSYQGRTMGGGKVRYVPFKYMPASFFPGVGG